MFCVLQGWSSAYSLESCIMQIAATLVKGKARIQFGASKVSNHCLLQQDFPECIPCPYWSIIFLFAVIFKPFYCYFILNKIIFTNHEINYKMIQNKYY